ncbi:MAG TPA: hypothetical protein VD905_16740 [Flavobacteriales bacterium]|nr:hypothetical protein [Flavobacteriales bacterium]
MSFLHFTSKGSRSSTLGIYVSIIFLIGWVVLFSLSFDMPSTTGPWWFWMLVLFLVLGFSIWVFKIDSVEIDVCDLRNGKFSIHINGPRTHQTFPEVQEYAFWYCVEHMRLRHGGGSFVKRFVKFRGVDGKEIIFKEMGGNEAHIPKHWPNKQYDPGEGKGVLHVHKLEEMVNFLVELRRQ